MKINFTYIIPNIQQIFSVKQEKNVGNKSQKKKKELSNKDNSSTFSEILENEIQKIKK